MATTFRAHIRVHISEVLEAIDGLEVQPSQVEIHSVCLGLIELDDITMEQLEIEFSCVAKRSGFASALMNRPPITSIEHDELLVDVHRGSPRWVKQFAHLLRRRMLQ